MIRYIAYKNINSETFFVNDINKEGKVTVIPRTSIKHLDTLKCQWNKAKEAKDALDGKRYKVMPLNKAQEVLDANGEFKF
jgi:hypothetical protein